MTDEEKAAKLKKLEKDLATVQKLAAGLKKDVTDEKDALRKEDLEAQVVMVERQVDGISHEIEGLKNAPKNSPKRLRSVFGRG